VWKTRAKGIERKDDRDDEIGLSARKKNYYRNLWLFIYIIYGSNNKKKRVLGLLLGKHFFIVNKFPHGAAPVILLLLLFATAVAAFNSNWFAWWRKTGAFYFANRPTPCDGASWIRNDVPDKKKQKKHRNIASCVSLCVCVCVQYF